MACRLVIVGLLSAAARPTHASQIWQYEPSGNMLAALPVDSSFSSFSSFEQSDVGVSAFSAEEPESPPSAVPEPSGCALFGFGLLFMLYLIRRRYAAMSV